MIRAKLMALYVVGSALLVFTLPVAIACHFLGEVLRDVERTWHRLADVVIGVRRLARAERDGAVESVDDAQWKDIR
jgi:hypothetical protein